MLSLWHDRVDGTMDLLASAVADEHPRVRLEAVCTLNVIGTPHALRICLEALNKPVDTFIEHALKIALLGRTGPSRRSGQICTALYRHSQIDFERVYCQYCPKKREELLSGGQRPGSNDFPGINPFQPSRKLDRGR